jgi:DNA-binding transcriptional ArsR family regulator
MLLCVLVEGELSVSELNRRVTLSQSALSQHLALYATTPVQLGLIAQLAFALFPLLRVRP